MNNYLYIILIILFSFYNLPAQDEETLAGELSIWIENNNQLKLVSMTLELVSPACWDKDHFITGLFNGGTVGDYINNGWLEFVCCWETQPEDYYRTFGLGLYKITAKVDGSEKAHFFIDYRTSHLPYASGLQLIDVRLKFNVMNNCFTLTYPSIGNVVNGSYYAIWDLKSLVQLQTEDLENYWDNCLAVFNNGDDHPKFVWGSYPGISNNYYKIYKMKESPIFVLYDSTTSTTYLDVNEEILTGLPHANEGYIFYKVTSVGYPTDNPLIPPYESGYSNTIDIRSLMPPLEKQGINSICKNDYNLLQNYPNPFNPSTTITFNIPQSENVTIRVFDILGNAVAELINEQKEAGTYTIKFDATNLASGIYFYQIQAGKYSETRKLILQK